MLEVVFNTLKKVQKSILTGVITYLLSTSLFANPVLDHIAAGQVSIQQSSNSTVINQSSQKAIINWHSFNIGAEESTHFQQPQGGIALNRINPSQGVSQIYGRLTASGQIILVNPAGIFFAPGSYVNVGGLIASTANISDQDFLNNYYRFTKDPGYNGAIVNQGTIIAANHGLIALVGGAVSNEGYIEANLGQVVLAAGDAYTMTFAGNDLVSFTVDSGVNTRAVDRNGQALRDGVTNVGTVTANGGRIIMTAKDAASVLDHVINMTGIAQTRSVLDGAVSGDGEIFLLGEDDNGKITVAGTFDASSTFTAKGGQIILKGYDLTVADGTAFNVGSTQGDGGFVETSGLHAITLGNLAMNTAAPNGRAGTWLIDPADINITTVDANITGSSPYTPTAAGSTLNVATLVAALASGNVTVLTTNDGFGGSGNITVSSGITWSSSNTLLLQAFNNIIINAPISGINGTLQLSAVNAAASITTGASGTVDVNNFNLLQGQWHQVGTLPSFNVRNNFQINSGVIPNATTQFIRATSGNGSMGSPYVLSDVYGLQGIGSNATTLTNHFVLGNDINAASTSTWNNNTGFRPNGNNTTQFSGSLNGFSSGVNHTINGLYFNSAAAYIGLFDSITSAASISNVGLTNVTIAQSVSGPTAVGALTAVNNGGVISNVYVTGNMTLNSGTNLGGLVGYNTGNISNAYSTMTITGYGGTASIGGLVGFNDSNAVLGNGNITNSYNAGNITVQTAPVAYLGGLVGQNTSLISNTFNSGNITQYSGYAMLGGLVGLNHQANIQGSISNSYNSGNVTNNDGWTGGVVGRHNYGTVSNVYNRGTISANINLGGVIGIADGTSTTRYAYNVGTINAGYGYAGGVLGGTISSNVVVYNVYNSGAVNGPNYTGAIVGTIGSTINNAFFDSQTSVATNALGYFAFGGVTGSPSKTTAEMMTYSTFSSTWGTGTGATTGGITNTPSTNATAPNYTWYIFEGNTRPILMMENTPTVRTNHQLQMMGAALGGNYTLANNIDMNTITAGDVWGVAFNSYNVASPAAFSSRRGFAPIGNNTNNFTGSFNGQNYTINKLVINTPTIQFVGLFGATSSSASISNLNLTSPVLYGSAYVGGIAGRNAGTISNASVTSTTGSGGWLGGELQVNNIDIRSTSPTGSGVYVGGISGENTGTISGSRTDVNLMGGQLGGIAGVNSGTITRSYSASNLGDGGYGTAGGLVGTNSATGIITESFHTGVVSAGYYSAYYGGIAGYNAGMIARSYNLGMVNPGFLNGAVGGLVGHNHTTGTIINSYNGGAIAYGQGQGGPIGGIAGSNAGVITNTYSYATTYYQYNPTGTESNGFVGSNTGTITNSFWDMGTSGYTRGYASNSGTINGLYAGCFGNTTCNGATAITNATNAGGTALNLAKANSFTTGGPTWDMSTVWNMVEDQSYPYLRDFYSGTPRAISGYHPAGSRFQGASIAYNGAVRDTTLSYNNGFIYFLEGNNTVSMINNSIADGIGVVVFTTSGGASNFATYAPTGGASISGVNGVILTANTLTATTSETNPLLITPLSNTQIVAATGGLSNPNLFFTGSGGNLTMNSGYSFATGATTIYDLSGNLTVTNANVTLNGPTIVTAVSPSITLNTSGNLTINNTVNGNNNALTVNSAGATNSINGVMSNLTSFTKAGTGTLTLAAANLYTGFTSVTGGTLAISADNNLGAAPGVFTANSIQLGGGGILRTTASFSLDSNRGITLNTGGGVITAASGTLTYAGAFAGANALTLNGSGNITVNSNITTPSVITVNSSVGAFTFGGTALTATAGALTLNAATTLTSASTVTLTATGATSDLTTNGLSWSGNNTVAFVAGRNIIISNAISGSSGSLTLSAVNAAQSITTGANGSVNVSNFNLLQGQWHQVTASLPAFTVGNNFRINSGTLPNATTQFIRATGGSGTVGSPYVLVDVYGLQGIASNTSTQALSYNLGGSINASATTNWNSGAGFVPINSYSGTFNGNGNTISNLFINRPATSNVGFFGIMAGSANVTNLALTNLNITGASFVGGLVGRKNAGTITSVSVGGAVTGSGSQIGGLAGYNVGAINGVTFSTVNVTATGTGQRIGGLVGENFGSITAASLGDIYYANGTVLASGTSGSLVGGLVGWNRGGVLTRVFSAGTATVTATTSSYVGGLVGQNDGGVTVVDSYSAATVNGGTYVTGGLIGFSYGTIAGNTYATGNVTGTQFVGGLIGAYQGGAITPASQGMIYATGNVSGTWEVGGLIGENYATISNVSYTNHSGGVNAPGASYVGGLIGLNFGSLSNSYADTAGTNIVGYSIVGGLIGGNGGNITGNVYANANVVGANNQIGGLVGYNVAAITAATQGQIYVTGTVTGNGGAGSNAVGGIVGYNDGGGSITRVAGTNAITISAPNYNDVGGIAGYNGGAISSSYNLINITATNNVGGITGRNAGTLTTVFSNSTLLGASQVGGLAGVNSGAITTSYHLGTVNGTGTNTGGVVGRFDGGSITDTFNLGVVAGFANSGGLVGHINNTSGPITNTYSAGLVLGTPGSVGGLIGFVTGTGSVVNNSYWNVPASGQANSAGGVGKTTQELMQQANFNAWNFSSVWNIIEGQSYPYLRNFYSTTPRIISGTSTAIGNTSVVIAVGGVIANNIKTGANGFFYRLYGANNITGFNDNLADGSTVLIFQSGAGSIGNVITYLPSSNGSLSGATGIVLDVNTVTVGTAGMQFNFNNLIVKNAKDTLNDNGILFSVDNSNNITLPTGVSFKTTANTNYNLTGDITTTNGNIILGGSTIINSTTSTLQTSGTGTINIADLDGNNNALVLSNTDANSFISGTISNLASFTKNGSGTLTLSGNNTFAGNIVINSGTVNVNHANALGSILGGTTLGSGATMNINGVMVGAEALNLNGGTFGGQGTAGFGGAISLNSGSVISNNGGVFTLSGAIDGSNALTLDGAGTTVLTGVIGNTTALTSLTANSNLSLGGASIRTSGDQVYLGSVALTADSLVESTGTGTGTKNITFNGAISGGNSLTLNGTGADNYQFTINAITANNVTVSGGLLSTSSTLNLDSGGTQNFVISGTNGGNVGGIATVAGTFNFTNIHSLNGGTANDSFALNGGTLAGSINGGAGTNHLTADNTSNVWSINAVNGGAVTGIGGTFANIQNVNGGSGADIFNFSGFGALSGSINGGAGVNSLRGANTANSWMINANNGGTMTGLGGTFANIQHLIGGTGLDIFNMVEGFSISGSIDGGDITNQNNIRFNTFMNRLTLYLAMPVNTVIDAGNVYDQSNSLITSFLRVQSSNGNNIGNIILPNHPNIKVTFYDASLLNGEIADPFYFYGWNVANVPAVSSAPPASVSTPAVAPIVNQPDTNSANNNNYSAGYGDYIDGNLNVYNKTSITPLLKDTQVSAGTACYKVVQ